ncbi:phage Mu protein F like protein [Actinocorallia herbida]|uniref:Phage Mu protein F like protein n=1 Tax=Actinocorallia herbida TaxID=58109 RepID=A0A3N1CMP3_9ACTN|nr:hypothetical protein [Actinocorallia herbida]ROO82589.1 phage Mu protein F like protein [Actinocorallia herbida]
MAVTRQTLQLTSTLRTYLDRIIDRATRMIVRGWSVAWDGLVERLRGAVAALLDRATKWPGRRAVTSSPRWRAAMTAVEQAMTTLQRIVRGQGNDAIQDAVSATLTAHQHMVASQYPPRELPTVPTLNDAAVGRIVRDADRDVHRHTRELPVTVTREMVQAMLKGVRVSSDPDTTIRRVMERLEKTYGQGLSKALTVVRTEVMDAHREAARQVQDESADVLAGWVWLSRADGSTCASCWALHGEVFELVQAGPYDHANGRCMRVPKAKTWEELGFSGMSEPEDEIPDGETLFWALPEATQRQIMGDRRLALLRSGKVRWADLTRLRRNPGWRDSYQVVPLRDLRPTT